MKRSVSTLAALAALTVLLSGCSLFSRLTGAQSSSAPPQSSSSAAESRSQAPPQSASSQENPASGHVVTPGEPAESQPGRVLTVTTDSEAFDRKFADNPIDKAYISESDQAVSTVDMVNVSQKYAGVWQDEVDHAYSLLTTKMSTDSSGKPAQYRAEQKSWEDGKAAALKKISSDALAAGGSMAEVDAASAVMDFYRSRAAKVYRELYDYDKNFEFGFQVKG